MAAAVIAVVDDDQVFCEMMVEFLNIEGYQPVVCLDTNQVAEFVQRTQPRLMLMDIRMGVGERGWAELHRLRQDPATNVLPIIVCSADHSFLQEHAQQLRDLNCRVLPKPFDLELLLQMIEEGLADGNGQ